MNSWIAIVNTDGAPVDASFLSPFNHAPPGIRLNAPHLSTDRNIRLLQTQLPDAQGYIDGSPQFARERGVQIVGDARLDARAELMGALSRGGAPVSERTSDVELVLYAYQLWAEECTEHLSGDFAFTLWDGGRHVLFGARDHFGVKPFYYAQFGNALLCSNQPDAIALYPAFSGALNESAIADWLLFRYVVDESATRFAEMQRLPPAHSLRLLGTDLRVRRYWTLPQDPLLVYKSSNEYVEHFQTLLDTAVADRLDEKSLSVFMSGGLDSSSLAVTAQRCFAARNRPFELHAYTRILSKIIPHDEQEYAALVAEAYNFPIHYIVADDVSRDPRSETALAVPRSPVGLPFRDAIHLQAQLAAESGPVAFSGIGGDPILFPTQSFLGRVVGQQPIAQLARDVGYYVRRNHHLPRLYFRSHLKPASSKQTSERERDLPPWYNAGFAARTDLRSRMHYAETARENHPFRPKAYAALTSPLWTRIFESNAPETTHVPLEVRFPFFDLRLVRFVFRVPPVPWFDDKFILRQAMQGRLPERVRSRPKTVLQGNVLWELARTGQLTELDLLPDVPELERFVDIPRVRREASSTLPENAFLLGFILDLAEWLWRGKHSSATPNPPESSWSGEV